MIDNFTKHTWIKTLTDKITETFLHCFIAIVHEYKRKPNKLRAEQGREIYNDFMQKWLGDNDILMYLTHNEGKSVAVERFIKTLKGKIYNN